MSSSGENLAQLMFSVLLTGVPHARPRLWGVPTSSSVIQHTGRAQSTCPLSETPLVHALTENTCSRIIILRKVGFNLTKHVFVQDICFARPCTGWTCAIVYLAV